MLIRPLDYNDAEAYRAIRLRSLWEHPHAFTSSAAEEQRKPLSWSQMRLADDSVTRFWGAFEGDVLGGIVGLHFEQREKNRHKATIIGMYLAPEWTGRGAGPRLLAAPLDYCREKTGVELLVLTVTRGNDSAQKLYEQAGFRSFGIEPGAIKVDGQPYDKEHMYLQLGPSKRPTP